jgi:serine/threonine-protein kinase
LDADELDDLFGRIALEKECITGDELKDALDARRHLHELGITDRTLADIMVQKGYVSDYEREEIVAHLEAGAAAGTTVHGYQVLLELESERPGKLYKAYQRAMDRTVLLQVLSKSVPEEAGLIPTLKREARLLAKLQHPGITAGYDAGETDEEYFLVSEFVEGIKLSQLLEFEGSLGEEESLKITLKVARAIEYLEEQNIIHRDIEPENILVARSGEAKIANFALAVAGDKIGGATDENIRTATPFYMSPEQAKGFAELDVRSDLFSLGATFFHMLTGLYPFGKDTEMALAHIITREAPDPRTVTPEISKLTAELTLKLLQKEPENRYQSGSEVRKRIEEILAAGVIPGEPAAGKPRKSGRSRRQRVKRASRMFQSHGAVAGTRPLASPVMPSPIPSPAVPRPTPAPSFAAHPAFEAPKPKLEPVRPRTAVITAARTGSPNTAIFAIIGMVVAIIVIIIVVASLSSGRGKPKERRPTHSRRTVKPEPAGPKVSDVAGEDIYPEDIKEFRKLTRLQNESPGSPEVIEKYNEFLTRVKDPGVKKAAEDALKGVLNTFYNSAQEEAMKLRMTHRYAQADALYRQLLSLIPESEKTPIQHVKMLLRQNETDSEMYYSQESSKAEGLIDRDDIDRAIAIYENLGRNSVKEFAEEARKVVAHLRRQKAGRDSPVGPTADRPPAPVKTPEEIEAQERKKEAEAKLLAMKQRIIAEMQVDFTSHIRGMRLPQARRVVKKALDEKKDPAILKAARQLEKHMALIDKSMAALEKHMQELYKKNIIELWLKKRRVELGELVKYESGLLLFKKRNNETIKIRLADIRNDEVERYMLEGFGKKTPENLLSMAVFFTYFYGDDELTKKYLGLAQAAGGNVQEFMNLLKGASFESALMMAEDELRKKKYLSAYLKLCRLRADYGRTESFKQREKHIEKITKKAYTSSGLGRLFVGKLTCKPPLFETFYDFAHSSQLNDFSPQLWDAKGTDLGGEIWAFEDDTLAGMGDGAVVWKGRAKGELSVSFFVEPREVGPFEVLLFADPAKLYQGRAYAFGFSTIVDEDDKDAEPEHYIALWDGKKEQYKYLKRGIISPELEEKKTYQVQIVIRHETLQLFRVRDSHVRFDNLTIKAKFDESWLRKAAKDAK